MLQAQKKEEAARKAKEEAGEQGEPSSSQGGASSSQPSSQAQPELSQPELSQPEVSQPELSQPPLPQIPNPQPPLSLPVSLNLPAHLTANLLRCFQASWSLVQLSRNKRRRRWKLVEQITELEEIRYVRRQNVRRI